MCVCHGSIIGVRDLPLLDMISHDIPGCVEDGAWVLWENSSVAVAVVAVVVVAHPGVGRGQLSVLLRLRLFRDARIDPSRQASTNDPNTTTSCRRKASHIKKNYLKNSKTIQKKRLISKSLIKPIIKRVIKKASHVLLHTRKPLDSRAPILVTHGCSTDPNH